MHRDVTFTQDTLNRIQATAQWLHTHAPDMHELAYGQPGSSPPDELVQTSDEQDLSSRVGRPAQHTWTNLVRAAKAALVELERAEYQLNDQFGAGTSPEPDRPGRDTRMPDRLARQVQAAATRRRNRGEWGPTPLGGNT